MERLCRRLGSHQQDRRQAANRRMTTLRSVYSVAIIGGVILSQIAPTFGGYVGLTGNWLPFALGLVVVAAGTALCLWKEGAPESRLTGWILVLYWVAAPVHTIILMFMFSELDVLAEYADLVRWGSIPVFFIGGLAFATKASAPARQVYWMTVALVVFTVLLCVNFFVEPMGTIQKLYVTKLHGFGRFAGNWNYPYDLSVALFFYIIVLWLGARGRSVVGWKIVSAVAIVVCGLMIVIGQSRGSLVALFGTAAAAATFHVARTIVRGRVRVGGRVGGTVGLVLLGGIAGLVVSNVAVSELLTQFGARLLRLAEPGALLESSARAEELATLVGYVKDSPLGLLTGFGPLRAEQVWVQNLLLFVLRYGVVGLGLYVLAVPFIVIYKSVVGRPTRGLRRLGLAYSAWVLFILMNGVSHDIFSHYRFIPLFYFVTGLLVGLERLQHGSDGSSRVRRENLVGG